MDFMADVMILIGAVLLTIGTDVVIGTAGAEAPIGQPLGDGPGTPFRGGARGLGRQSAEAHRAGAEGHEMVCF